MQKITNMESKSHGDKLFPFAFYHLDYDPDTTILDMHWHSELEFLTVTEGAGVFYLGESEILLSAGECLIIGGGTLHRGYTAPGRNCSFNAFVFDPKLVVNSEQDRIRIKYIDPVLLELRRGFPLISPSGIAERQILKSLTYISNLAEAKDLLFELAIKTELLKTFGNLYRIIIEKDREINSLITESPRTGNIKEALSYIHNHYKENISLEDLASAAGMSDSHFSRTFKSLVTKTPIEYLHYYRINCSVFLLKETNLPLLHIAQDVGYESVSYFIRRFQNIMKCTPRWYRKN